MFLSITMSLLVGPRLSPVPVEPVPVDDLQTQSTATTLQSFTAVEGADLMARLEAAQARGAVAPNALLVRLHVSTCVPAWRSIRQFASFTAT